MATFVVLRWWMLKGPGLILLVLDISIFQDRPDRGHKMCSKKVLKNVLTKKVKNDIGLINVQVHIFIYFDMGPINFILVTQKSTWCSLFSIQGNFQIIDKTFEPQP